MSDSDLPRCPACHSLDLHFEESWSSFSVPFGSAQTYKEVNLRCSNCHGLTPFDNTGFRNAFQRSEKDAFKSILQQLEKQDILAVYIERVLNLRPFGLLGNVASSGNVPAELSALMKVVATIPWILDVADHKYARNVLQHHVRRASIETDILENGNIRHATDLCLADGFSKIDVFQYRYNTELVTDFGTTAEWLDDAMIPFEKCGNYVEKINKTVEPWDVTYDYGNLERQVGGDLHEAIMALAQAAAAMSVLFYATRSTP